MAFHSNLKGLDLHNSRIQFYSGNPNNNVEAFAEGEMCINPDSGAIYTATGPGFNNWVAIGGGSFSGTTDDIVDGDDTETFKTAVTKIKYVDSNRTDGYIENGSINRPFKTISAAVSASSADDIVYLMPGDYNISSTIELNDVFLMGHDYYSTVIGDDGVVPITGNGTFALIGLSVESTNAPCIRTDTTQTGEFLVQEVRFISRYTDYLPSDDQLEGSCPVGSTVSFSGDSASTGMYGEFYNCHFGYGYTGPVDGDQAHCYVYQGEGVDLTVTMCNDNIAETALDVSATGSDWIYGAISPIISNNSNGIGVGSFYINNVFHIRTDPDYSFNGRIVSSIYVSGSQIDMSVMLGNTEACVRNGSPSMYAAYSNNKSSTGNLLLTNTQCI